MAVTIARLHGAPGKDVFDVVKPISLYAASMALCLSACTFGPDYRRPMVAVPQSFTAGVAWRRADANPQGAISSTWWTSYRDPQLTALIGRAMAANPGIEAQQAADRVAHAVVAANVAGLFPTVAGTLTADKAGPSGGNNLFNPASFQPAFGSTLSASWELDLWGKVRRQIQSSRAAAEASDAELAGERLSITSSVAAAYFQLRQADVDTELLRHQERIDSELLGMTKAAFTQGAASNDQVLSAQNTLEAAIAARENTEAAREQYEHAIAVLVGVPPETFHLAPDPAYRFVVPDIPVSVPSELLERRYDVVSAERTAAAASAQIGVAIAAFFPSLSLSAEFGLESNMLGQLFSLPNQYWILGPTLAPTFFEGGARRAALGEARATFDQDAATYRQTVLAAFQSVEDSLSTLDHLRQQARAFAGVYDGSSALFASQKAQLEAGTASRQNVLGQQLTLLQAQQSLTDTQALMVQDSVGLIKNLGGGWQWHGKPGLAPPPPAPRVPRVPMSPTDH